MPAGTAAFGSSARRGTPTVPSVRSAFGGSASNASSCSVTLPAIIASGDIGVVVVCTAGNSVLTGPSGWLLLDSRLDDGASGTIRVAVYKRQFGAGFGSSTITVNRALLNNATITVSGVIVQNGGDVGIIPRLGHDPISALPNGQTVRFPAVKPGPQDLVLAVGGARGYASIALAAPKIATQPTGFTIQDNRSDQINGLAQAYASWICSGPASSANGTTLTCLLGDQTFRIGGLLTISPAGRRPTGQLPASLANVAIHGYGESYLGYASDGYSHASEAHWYDRIARALGTPIEDNDMGLPGAMATDVVGFAYGTVSYYTRAGQFDTSFTLQQPGTWMSQAQRSGLVLMDLLGNDAFNHASTASGGTTAKSLAGARNASEALVRLVRAASVVEASTFTLVGTWLDSTITDASNGNAKYTQTPGNTATFTFSGTGIDLIMLALDDSALTVPGSPFTVHVDGVLKFTGTTSNQMRQSAASAFRMSPWCQMPVPLRNLSAGSHTVVVTHTGSAGQSMHLDCYLVPAATPPWIVLNKLPHYAAALFTALPWPSSNAIIDTYNAICDTIAALFPDGRVLVYDPLDPLQGSAWDITTMITTYDNAHLNDSGAAHYGSGITRLLQERVA